MESTRTLGWITLLQVIDTQLYEPTWMYPNVPSEHLQVLLHRINVEKDYPEPFFMKYQETWIYLRLANPTAVLAISSKSFDPEKYDALLRVLIEEYNHPPSTPLSLLRVYLSLFTTARYTNPRSNITFTWNKKQEMAPYIAGFTLEEFIVMFGEDSAVVWLAVITKKRIVVASDHLHELLQITRCLPQFAWHRQDWNILRPYCRLSALEIADLTGAGAYCTGVLSAECHEIPYDILLDVPRRRVHVADSCRDLFSGLEWHKECTDIIRESHGQKTIEILAKKTSNLIDMLKTMTLTSLDDIQDPLKWAIAVAEELI